MKKSLLSAVTATVAVVGALIAHAEPAGAGLVDALERPAMQSPVAAKRLLVSVTRVDERLVAVGPRGHIVVSTDAALRERQAQGQVVAMVGDGVNDAPALAQADVSFALADGAQIARSAADAVLLSGRVGEVAQALQLARRTVRVMRQNLAWAALYNAACVPLALLGYLPPWAAGLGMAASSALVVVNAARLARTVAVRAEPVEAPASPSTGSGRTEVLRVAQ